MSRLSQFLVTFIAGIAFLMFALDFSVDRDAIVYSYTDDWGVEEVTQAWGMTLTHRIGSADIIVQEGDLPPGILGLAQPPRVFLGIVVVPCFVTVDPDYKNLPGARGILSHELGHCTGLKHTEEGLMSVAGDPTLPLEWQPPQP